MEKQEVTAFIGLNTVANGYPSQHLKRLFGVDTDAILRFDIYLSHRSFYVSVEGTASVDKDIDFSVPQGSILGPVLYSVHYASPLSEVINTFSASVIGYADNHDIYDAFTPGLYEEINTISNLKAC